MGDTGPFNSEFLQQGLATPAECRFRYCLRSAPTLGQAFVFLVFAACPADSSYS